MTYDFTATYNIFINNTRVQSLRIVGYKAEETISLVH